jgi:cathepsin L
VAVGVDARTWAKYTSGLLNCFSPSEVNHAVVLVGYTVEGHWLIKNSYGTTWGENGYVTLDKNNNCLMCKYSGISVEVD